MNKQLQPNRIEWLSFFGLAPIVASFLNYLLFGASIFHRFDVWLYSFPLICVQGLGSWYLHIVIMHWLRIVFPDIKQTAIRLILLGITHVLLISLTYISLFYFYDAIHLLGYQLEPGRLRLALFVGVSLTLVATSMWEADYTLSQWKGTVAEKEKLEQLTLQQEFDTLKGQVNPHFLFNCFNTLSSLISEDRKQADAFLNELSKVYRYLLKNNEDGLSTIDIETKFIASYYQLMKTRHGDSVQVNIEIDKKYQEYLLPSLSLQMLVENAVKHNVLSKNHPLIIDIFTTTGNKLVVSNNLQARTVKAPSNKIGLENIRQKYQLLHQAGFQVLEDKRTFTVVLPLIYNKVINNKTAFIKV